MSKKPTDTTKAVDDLKPGDWIVWEDEPLEVTHTQTIRDRSSSYDTRVLVVFGDGSSQRYASDAVFEMANDAQIADAARRQQRNAVIDDLVALANWYAAHPDVPVPLTIEVRIVPDGEGWAEKQASVRAIAAAMGAGAKVRERDGSISARFEFRDYSPTMIEIVASAWGATPAQPVEAQADA